MKKIVLLFGPSCTYGYYAETVNKNPRFNAILKLSCEEAIKFAASGEAEIAMVVTDLFMTHSLELGTMETGEYAFTGAAMVKWLRKHCPNSIYFLLGAKDKDIATISEYSGGVTSDIIRLPHGSVVTPDFLVRKLEELIPNPVPA